MKIALVAEWLDPARGGAETSTRQFINALIDRGVSLQVFTRSHLPGTPEMQVQTIATRAPGRAASTAEFIRKAEAATRDAGCDLIHALTPCAGADIYQPRGGLVAETICRTAATRPSRAGQWLKRTLMSLNARQRMMLAKERAWFTGDQRPVVIAISGYVVRQLKSHYNYPSPDIRHILNGVHVAASTEADRAANRRAIRERHAIGPDVLTLLAVCHNFRLKGVAALINSLGVLRRRNLKNVRAVIVGRENPTKWLRMARREGVDDNVVFAGSVENPIPYFHAADVLVHPTYYDPCSRVVLEAVSIGLPVICTRFDGASEVITDGVSGYVIDTPGESDTLADRISTLSDANVRKPLVAASRSASRMVTMERHADEVFELYRSLLETRARPTAASAARANS